ncbi:MAG: VanZ family protein [Desulfosoma sp.]
MLEALCEIRQVNLSRRTWGIVLIVYLGVLTVLALAPMDSHAWTPRFLVNISANVQNLMHIPCFGLLSLIALQTFMDAGKRRRVLTFIAVGISTVLYSGILETAQAFVPGRYGSLTDLLFNVVGIVGGLALWQGLEVVRSSIEKSSMGKS